MGKENQICTKSTTDIQAISNTSIWVYPLIAHNHIGRMDESSQQKFLDMELLRSRKLMCEGDIDVTFTMPSSYGV